MDNPLRRPEEILAFRTLREIFAPRPRQVWSVGPTDSVFTALQIMSDKDIGFLPVFQCHGLVGVLSERDCARKAVLRRKPLESTPVATSWCAMSSPSVLTATFADLSEAHASTRRSSSAGGRDGKGECRRLDPRLAQRGGRSPNKDHFRARTRALDDLHIDGMSAGGRGAPPVPSEGKVR